MSLKYMRTDVLETSGVVRVWYRDDYGQPRFFEFSTLSPKKLPATGPCSVDCECSCHENDEIEAHYEPIDFNAFGQELIREVDGFAPERKKSVR